MQVLLFQTADAFVYEPMLRATSRTVIEFCRRAGCSYESFIGIKRGYWPWQATYNRIVFYEDLLRRGFEGWAIYLDADAYVVDLDFDIRGYLADKSRYAAIFASACATDNTWDVNAGVGLINTAHPVGRTLIETWSGHFSRLSDEVLRDARTWLDADNDQAFLQTMLQTDGTLLANTFIAPNTLINSSFASFIRQHLRQYTPDLATRVRQIAEATDLIVGAGASAAEEGGPAASAALAEQAVEALYRGVLQREPDDAGRRHAVAGLQTLGFADGLRHLASSLVQSSEREALAGRTPVD